MYLANKVFKGEAPPRSNRAKEMKKVGKMHGHVMAWAVIDTRMDGGQLLYVLCHVVEIGSRSGFSHGAHAHEQDHRYQLHGVIQNLMELYRIFW